MTINNYVEVRDAKSIWYLQDAAVAETVMIQDARGQAPAKRQRRAVQLHQRRLQQLCFDVRDGRKSVPEALNAFGHCVRLL